MKLNPESHYSGATARDSHPLPNSPHLMGHPDAFKYKEQSLMDADTIMRSPAVSNSIFRRVETPKASGSLLQQFASSKIHRIQFIGTHQSK
jgi:hypothetical protein